MSDPQRVEEKEPETIGTLEPAPQPKVPAKKPTSNSWKANAKANVAHQWSVDKASKKQDDEAMALLQAEDEAHFLDSFGYYAQQYYTYNTHVKAPGKISLNSKYQGSLDQVLYVLQLWRTPGQEQKALDTWGAVRPLVAASIASVKKHGGHDDAIQKAQTGVNNLDQIVPSSMASKVIKDEVDKVGAKTHADAAFHEAEFKAVKGAVMEAHKLMEKGSSVAKIAEPFKEGSGTLQVVYAIFSTGDSLGEVMEAAHKHNFWQAASGVAGLLSKTMMVVSGSLKAINALAHIAWKEAGEEGEKLFAHFAERIAEKEGVDVAAHSGEIMGKAVSFIEIAKGVFDLIDGISHGNAEKAFEGAEEVLMGTTSLLLEGAGAGAGAAAVGPALVFMFAETVKECIAVGGLIRAMKHIKEMEIVGNFCDRAGKLGNDAAGAFASLAALRAPAEYSKDKTMNAHVLAQLEVERDDYVNRVLAGFQKDLIPMFTDKGDHGLGQYPDAIKMLGPATVGAIRYIMDPSTGGDKKVNPDKIAWNCITIFQGISQMGQWAQAAHGYKREEEENEKEKEQLEKRVDKEWQAADDLAHHRKNGKYDWETGPEGPTDAELQEYMP
jgi:hypothetical protein